jgi:hypothetical protein
VKTEGQTRLNGELLSLGQPRHRCNTPGYEAAIRDGAVWRCECGQHHEFDEYFVTPSSRSGRWHKISRWKAQRLLRRSGL